MLRTLFMLAAIALLGACGDDQPAQKAQKTSAAPPPVASSSASPAAMPAAMDEEETLIYDDIDVSKLDGQWWKQYNAGG